MKECYSAKAIQDMFFYAQVHMIIEFVLLMMFIVLFVFVLEKLYHRKQVEDTKRRAEKTDI